MEIVEGSIRLEKIIKNNKYEPLIKDLARYFLLMLNVDSYSDDEFDNYLKNTKIQNSNLQYMFNELILIRSYYLKQRGKHKRLSRIN